MSINTRPIRTIECCMILYRTANIPIGAEAEAKGSALISQSASGGNVLISTIGLPAPQTLGGTRYVAWIRGTPSGQKIPVQLLQTGPVVTEPGVWTGAFVFGPGESVAIFQDILVTAENEPPFVSPNLSSIALIGLFSMCR